jgi:hypothetical protein
LVEKAEGKRTLQKLGPDWKNIKTDLKGKG